MKKILFLGYNSNQTKIIEKIKYFKKNITVKQSSKKVSYNVVKNFDLVISFGYRHIIEKEIISKFKNLINVHIGFLPYNRGAHPNFWSFMENTPSGVTIHKIDEGIDTGNIIYQKLIDFDLNKNRKRLTFSNTYKKLIGEIENIFIENIKSIININFEEFKQTGKGSYHHSNELPNLLKSWDQNIYMTVMKYEKQKREFIKKKLDLLDQIEQTRKKNNINWMNILRNSLKVSPSKTLEILDMINQDDDKISKLFKKINEK